jgi:hypothetical protein
VVIGISSSNISPVSQQQGNESQRLIPSNAHLGKTHKVQSQKFGDAGIFGSNLQENFPKGKTQPNLIA